MSEIHSSTSQRGWSPLLSRLIASKATHSPFVELLERAAALPSTTRDPKQAARSSAALEAARNRWQDRPCNQVSYDEIEAWMREVAATERIPAVRLLALAATSQAIIEAGSGTKIIDGDLYANPVWAASVGKTGAGLLGLVTGLIAQSLARIGAASGGADSIALHLRRSLGKNVRIWVTDTNIVFVGYDAPLLAGDVTVHAIVPLNDIVLVKKAPRLQLLPRFSIRFTDGSKASFMSFSKVIAGLKSATGK